MLQKRVSSNTCLIAADLSVVSPSVMGKSCLSYPGPRQPAAAGFVRTCALRRLPVGEKAYSSKHHLVPRGQDFKYPEHRDVLLRSKRSSSATGRALTEAPDILYCPGHQKKAQPELRADFRMTAWRAGGSRLPFKYQDKFLRFKSDCFPVLCKAYPFIR